MVISALSNYYNYKPEWHLYIFLAKIWMVADRRYARIVSSGSDLPKAVIGNEEWETRLGLEPGYIENVSGIKARRYASPEEAFGSMACRASINAVDDYKKRRGHLPEKIDLVVCGRATPANSNAFSMVGTVLEYLGSETDIELGDVDMLEGPIGCSGALVGLNYIRQCIERGEAERGLFVGGSRLSEFIDPLSRGSMSFGDGVGAWIVEASYECGILSYKGCMVPNANALRVSHGEGGYKLFMQGRETAAFVLRNAPRLVGGAIELSGYRIVDVDKFLFHQANMRLNEAVAGELDVPRSQLVSSPEYGNTSIASLPILWTDAVKSGEIKENNLVVLCGYGVGLHAAAMVVKV